MKKYEFTGETKKIGNRDEVTVRMIRAIATFGDVKAGDLGGWIEKEENLSHINNAWVYGNAEVCGDAEVYGDAKVCGNAKVYGDAEVCGNAKVYGDAEVCGDAKVYGDAEVYGDAKVCGDAKVYGDAEVYGDAKVCGDARVYGDAKVYGDAEVYGDAKVCGNAEVLHRSHLLVTGPIGSRNSFTTFFRDKDNGITVRCGCFVGKADEFLEKVKETHGDNKHALVYRAAVEVAKKHINFI